MKQGCVHVYTGDGKGKTTASVGLAVRAVGQGLNVGFFQFLKSGISGEVVALAQLGVEVFSPQAGSKFVWEMNEGERAACAELQQNTLERAMAMMGELDLLILDEVVCAIDVGMLSEKELLRLIENRPQELELVITGRGASEEIMQLADYVTEMVKHAHPYDQGHKARSGIEY